MFGGLREGTYIAARVTWRRTGEMSWLAFSDEGPYSDMQFWWRDELPDPDEWWRLSDMLWKDHYEFLEEWTRFHEDYPTKLTKEFDDVELVPVKITKSLTVEVGDARTVS